MLACFQFLRRHDHWHTARRRFVTIGALVRVASCQWLRSFGAVAPPQPCRGLSGVAGGSRQVPGERESPAPFEGRWSGQPDRPPRTRQGLFFSTKTGSIPFSNARAVCTRPARKTFWFADRKWNECAHGCDPKPFSFRIELRAECARVASRFAIETVFVFARSARRLARACARKSLASRASGERYRVVYGRQSGGALLVEIPVELAGGSPSGVLPRGRWAVRHGHPTPPG